MRARAKNRSRKNLVGFRLDDVHYAVEIGRVREIIRPLPVVPLNHAPPAVLGVSDFREEVIPVIDVRQRFHLSTAESTRKTKWIVVELGHRWAGLVVDAVSGVIGTEEEDRREVPSVGAGDAARAISAVYAHDGSLVFVLDVDRVASVAEVLDLSAVSLLKDAREAKP